MNGDGPGVRWRRRFSGDVTPVPIAFADFVLFAGSNAAAVKTVLDELAPL